MTEGSGGHYHFGDSSNSNISSLLVQPLEEIVTPFLPPTQPNVSFSQVSSPSSTPVPLQPGSKPSSDSHLLAYVLIPLGSLALIVLLAFLVMFILRKSKLDRLRHHLMPLYNFDPMDEEADWESELLEEEKEQHVALNIRGPTRSHGRGPKLKFHTDV